jgi:hypothetical protein
LVKTKICSGSQTESFQDQEPRFMPVAPVGSGLVLAPSCPISFVDSDATVPGDIMEHDDDDLTPTEIESPVVIVIDEIESPVLIVIDDE